MNGGAHSAESEDDGEDAYNATPPRRLARSTNNTTSSSGAASQSQPPSFASSMPASQLRSQSQGNEEDEEDGEAEEEDAGLASSAAALSIDAPISSARLDVFRRTLGQLQSTNLFEEDKADPRRSDRRREREARLAARRRLQQGRGHQGAAKMNDDNQVM